MGISKFSGSFELGVDLVSLLVHSDECGSFGKFFEAFGTSIGACGANSTQQIIDSAFDRTTKIENDSLHIQWWESSKIELELSSFIFLKLQVGAKGVMRPAVA